MTTTLKRSLVIGIPKLNNGMPIIAVDYEADKRGPISLQKAKDVVFAAILNGDYVYIEETEIAIYIATAKPEEVARFAEEERQNANPK